MAIGVHSGVYADAFKELQPMEPLVANPHEKTDDVVKAVARASMGDDQSHLKLKREGKLSNREVSILEDASLGDENVDVDSPLTELDRLQEEENGSRLGQALQECMTVFEQELERGEEADQERLYYLALSIVYLQMVRAGRTDALYAKQKTKELDEHVKNLQKSYKNTGAIVFQVASAAVSIFAGACGLSGCIPGLQRVLSPATIDTLSKNAPTFSTLGQAVNFSGPLENKQQGLRTVYQNDKEKAELSRQSINDNKGRMRGTADTLNQTARAAQEAEHQARRAILG